MKKVLLVVVTPSQILTFVGACTTDEFKVMKSMKNTPEPRSKDDTRWLSEFFKEKPKYISHELPLGIESMFVFRT